MSPTAHVSSAGAAVIVRRIVDVVERDLRASSWSVVRLRNAAIPLDAYPSSLGVSKRSSCEHGTPSGKPSGVVDFLEAESRQDVIRAHVSRPSKTLAASRS